MSPIFPTERTQNEEMNRRFICPATRCRYAEAYQVDQKLQNVEQDTMLKTVNRDIIPRMKINAWNCFQRYNVNKYSQTRESPVGQLSMNAVQRWRSDESEDEDGQCKQRSKVTADELSCMFLQSLYLLMDDTFLEIH
ncbi:hypothetical protein QJS10_CPB22g00734 [Acorus calamus]|uniref:Uncharacterized protein n=1 Tax=Acorus calamus TaxID=4465 RepID=A0AAV9C209_ACOCL|nr:hypothetical protein QJS10_CPB22g00734 [Acorus calamus]